MSLSWGGAFLIDTDESLDQGDKIILPSTALQQLLAKAPGGELPSPLTFCLRHPHRSDIMIHGGVKEFSGLDNRISLPLWMMDALGLKQDERVVIAYKQLPKGTWARLRSLTPNDAPRIQNYRATLEAHLRQHYNTLTAGQTLTCRYGAMEYPFLVVDLQPAPAVCVTDTDLEVDLEDIMVDQAQTGSSSHASSGQASSMIPISLNSTKQSTVEKDTYRYFELTGLSPGITKLSMSVTVSTGDLDVVIGYGRLPTLEQNDLLDISSDKDRQLQVDLTTLDETKRSLTIGIHGFVDSNYTLTIDVENKGSAEVSSNNTPAPEDTVNKQQCQNCHAYVPVASLALHETFCSRNNILCPWGCEKVFQRNMIDQHWHCDQCTVTGDSLPSKGKHMAYAHTDRSCEACGELLPSVIALAAHHRTSCPQRLITCRYCHNLVAQGALATDPRDRILGLSEHESYCGSRTIQCQKCSKSIPIKDVPVHAKIHEVHRQQQRLPPLCSNTLCVRPRANNRLGLCQYCFGPFWVTEDDPQNVKLLQRVARKLHSQLTNGCGHGWCQNKTCATGSGTPQEATAAATTLLPIIKKLRVQLAMPKPKPELYFCVDEKTSRLRFLADTLKNDAPYGVDWCIKALETEQEDLDRARRWLDTNAPTL